MTPAIGFTKNTYPGYFFQQPQAVIERELHDNDDPIKDIS